MTDVPRAAGWRPPASWRTITTVDAHTAGEPFRVVLSGGPPIPGDSMLAKRRFAQARLDRLRTALMWEPRGHADICRLHIPSSAPISAPTSTPPASATRIGAPQTLDIWK